MQTFRGQLFKKLWWSWHPSPCSVSFGECEFCRSTSKKAPLTSDRCRDRLCVVTNALFNQRDFRDTHILIDFATTLELSIKTQLTESGIYMGKLVTLVTCCGI